MANTVILGSGNFSGTFLSQSENGTIEANGTGFQAAQRLACSLRSGGLASARAFRTVTLLAVMSMLISSCSSGMDQARLKLAFEAFIREPFRISLTNEGPYVYGVTSDGKAVTADNKPSLLYFEISEDAATPCVFSFKRFAYDPSSTPRYMETITVDANKVDFSSGATVEQIDDSHTIFGPAKHLHLHAKLLPGAIVSSGSAGKTLSHDNLYDIALLGDIDTEERMSAEADAANWAGKFAALGKYCRGSGR